MPYELLDDVPKGRYEMLPDEPKRGGVLQGAGNLAAGLVRGAGSIGATLVAPWDMMEDAISGKGLSLESNRQRREAIDGALEGFGAQPDSWMYKGGKLAGEIAGSAGSGGLVAKGLGGIPLLANSTKAAPLLEAIQTAGMKAGGAGLGTRVVGGAITGGASAGLVNPDDATTGALIGGATPAVLKLAGAVGSGIGNVYRAATTSDKARIASKLAEQTGLSTDEVVSALRQEGPQLIPGYKKTVPQIIQSPELSQLQRTLKTSGANALGDAERAQQAAYMEAINRVAPVDVTVNDAANRAGSAIKDYAVPARETASRQVRAAFDAVDPFGESALHLPINEMQQAKSKFLGPGTFGTGSKAAQAIETAKNVGTMELPAIAPLSRSASKQGQTLEQAVRSAGGIRGRAGEVMDLGAKQSGTTGLLNNKSGKSADLLASEMHQRGFIPDADPSTLLDMLRNGGGRKAFANDVADDVFSSGFERAMGDMPGAETISKAVPFQTLQNLRSSIGEAAEQAASKGANKEAAALRQMVSAIDDKVSIAANGGAGPGEMFAKDMADQYRQALGLHAGKMAKFETGPQIGMFRKGADGQAAIQGAEIPGKFFSGRASQVEDMQAFKRLAGDVPHLMDEMKRFAVTEGANTATAQGELASKFVNWAKARSGASRELFSPNELATIKEVAKSVERSLKTEGLGRVTNSDTAQKLASMQSLGLLDSKALDVLANRIPYVKSLSGPVLQGMRNMAAQKQNTIMAGLLANPEEMASVLASQTPRSGLLDSAMARALPITYRTAPVGLLGFGGQ